VTPHHVVVGGGFAGLAAAVRLARGGARVTLLERRPFLGGRAYSFTDPVSGDVVRPGAATTLPNLFLAGDWIRTGLPATIESAVQTGREAARLALAAPLAPRERRARPA